MADITIISTKCTWVEAGSPDTNKDGNDWVYIGRDSTGLYYILVEFDLATCPVGIKTALLYLNVSAITGNGCDGTITRNTASWVENTVTWNNKPATTGDYGTIALTATGAKSVAITTLVKEWKAGTYSNYGTTITTAVAATNYAKARSDDYATEAERPRLVVTPEVSGFFHWFYSEAWQKHDKLWKPKLILPKEGFSY